MSSCSLFSSDSHNLTDFESVSIEGDHQEHPEAPSINEEDHFGPQIGMITSVPTQKKKIPITYLILGGIGYRAAGHVPVLSKIRKNGIKIHYISGEGLGIVVATMFAANMSQSRIEWSLYRLFDQIQKFRPYKSKWLDQLEEGLEDIFGEANIEDLTMVLQVPIYDKDTRRYQLISSGPIVGSLMKTFESNKRQPQNRLNEDIDLLFYLNTSENGKEHIPYKEESSMIVINLPVNDMPSFDREKLPSYLQLCGMFSGEALKQINGAIEDWKLKRVD